MGCICSKGIATDENIETVRKASLSSKSLKRFVTLTKKEEPKKEEATVLPSSNDGGAILVNSKPKADEVIISMPVELSDEEKAAAAVAVDWTKKAGGHQRRATVDVGANRNGSRRIEDRGDVNEAEAHLGMNGVPNGFSGEHVIAGWPSWLTSVAGEAVKGWLPRRADSFEKLDKVIISPAFSANSCDLFALTQSFTILADWTRNIQ